MAREPRIAKSLDRRLADLDDHLFLLREHLYRLNEDVAHLKVLTAELRVLICFSSGTEGLLWRLTKEVQVSDEVYLHVAGNVNTQHPQANGLLFAFVPIERAGLGDPTLVPDYYSLRELVKEHEAVFLAGRGLTHEYLIKAIAQQMGSAHEDDGLEPSLVELSDIFITGTQPYIPILTLEAELTLEVGERVLKRAEHERGFTRKQRAGKPS